MQSNTTNIVLSGTGQDLQGKLNKMLCPSHQKEIQEIDLSTSMYYCDECNITSTRKNVFCAMVENILNPEHDKLRKERIVLIDQKVKQLKQQYQSNSSNLKIQLEEIQKQLNDQQQQYNKKSQELTSLRETFQQDPKEQLLKSLKNFIEDSTKENFKALVNQIQPFLNQDLTIKSQNQLHYTNSGLILSKSSILQISLPGHRQGVRGLRYMQEDKLISTGLDQTIRIWNLKEYTHKILEGLEGENECKHFTSIYAITSFKNYVITGDESGYIVIQNLAQQNSIQQNSIRHKVHDQRIYSLDISKSGTFLLSASEDRTAILWEIKLGSLSIEKRESWKSKDIYKGCAFSNDEKWIALINKNKQLSLIDSESLGEKRQFTCKDCPQSIAFNPLNPDYIACGIGSTEAKSCSVEIWNVFQRNNDQPVYILQIDDCKWVQTVAFTPSGLYLVAGGEDKKVRVWKIERKQELQQAVQNQLQQEQEQELLPIDFQLIDDQGLDFESYVRTVAVSPNSTQIAVGLENGSVCLLPLI